MKQYVEKMINMRNHAFMGSLNINCPSVLSAKNSVFNSSSKTFLGRLGNVEYNTLLKYNKLTGTTRGATKSLNRLVGFTDRSFNKSLTLLNKNAGAYSVDAEDFHKFNSIYLNALDELDVYAKWFAGDQLIAKWKPGLSVIPLEYLNILQQPTFYDGVFDNKKILVVSSFENSILQQYNTKKDLLFHHLGVNKLTLFHIQSPYNINKTGKHQNWYQDLSILQEKVEECVLENKIDYVIVGAGAFGLPLAFHAYKLGVNALHLGGATQLLFGVKGNRWTAQIPKHSRFWMKPLPSDVPKFSNEIENGCYW